MRHSRDQFGVVVNVLGKVPNDGVDALLRELLENSLGAARPLHELVNHVRRSGGRFFQIAAYRGFERWAGHAFLLAFEFHRHHQLRMRYQLEFVSERCRIRRVETVVGPELIDA